MNDYVFEPARTPEDGKRIMFDIPQQVYTRRVISKVIAPELIADTVQKLRVLGCTPICVVKCRMKG